MIICGLLYQTINSNRSRWTALSLCRGVTNTSSQSETDLVEGYFYVGRWTKHVLEVLDLIDKFGCFENIRAVAILCTEGV